MCSLCVRVVSVVVACSLGLGYVLCLCKGCLRFWLVAGLVVYLIVLLYSCF